MRAVIYSGRNVVEVVNVPEPALQDAGDALVKVTLTAICGTDLHLIGGDFPGFEPGSIVGHEFVGEVVAVGSGVRRIRTGDRVMASDFTACGHCRWCSRGDHWECGDRAFFGSGTSFGPDLTGAQADWVRVPLADTTLCRIPDGISDDAAILVGDNLATGWAAIERGGVAPGDTVAVLGGGAVGQLASLSAQAAGAAVVVLVEPNAKRRQFAENQGALTCPPDQAADLVRRLADGDGADVVIEAAGHLAVLRAAFDLVRKRGRIVSIGGHGAESWTMPLAQSFAAELSLTFAIGDSIRLRDRLFSLIRSRILDPTVVIDARIPFSAAPDMYRQLKAQTCLKAVIDPAL